MNPGLHFSFWECALLCPELYLFVPVLFVSSTLAPCHSSSPFSFSYPLVLPFLVTLSFLSSQLLVFPSPCQVSQFPCSVFFINLSYPHSSSFPSLVFSPPAPTHSPVSLLNKSQPHFLPQVFIRSPTQLTPSLFTQPVLISPSSLSGVNLLLHSLSNVSLFPPTGSQ